MVGSQSHFFHVSTSGEIKEAADWQGALAAAKAGGYAWLDYSLPTREELSALIEPLGIHPLSIEDCTDSNQIPKIEDYPTNTFMLFNIFVFSDHALAIQEMDAIIGADFLVTVHPPVEAEYQMMEQLQRLPLLEREGIRNGPAFLLHALVDRVVDAKFFEIERMEDELAVLEDGMLADLQKFDPSELLHLRRDLLTARKSLFYEREVLVRICRGDFRFIGEKAIYGFRDIYDHLARLFELTETSRDVVTSLMEMYLSMLNNQMAQAANDTNQTVRLLTFITTIFMPLSLLAGIGGMSEYTMMTGAQNWKIAYPLFILAMIVIGAVNFYLLRLLEKKTGSRL